MHALPLEIYQAEQIREIEQAAIHIHHIEETELMIQAALASFNQILTLWPESHQIIVICGPGNNGGDGYYLAKLAKAHKLEVVTYYVQDPNQLSGAAKWAYEEAKTAGVHIEKFSEMHKTVDVIVDAIFGTGLSTEIKGPFLRAIEWINNQDANVFALDVPSGIHSDTGSVMGEAVVADATMTFIGLKPGLLTGAAVDYTGELYYADLKLPTEIFLNFTPYAIRLTYEAIQDYFTPRPLSSYKADFGHVLIIGGDYGMAGAVSMAAAAALRVGAGLVSVVTRKEHIPCVVTLHPEVMCHADEYADLALLAHKATVIVIGPGLGRDKWGRELFTKALTFSKPMVIDADGLFFLKDNKCPSHCVITPHPGEAAHLLGKSNEDIQQDRFKALSLLHEQYAPEVAVLKGAGSLLLSEEAVYSLCDAGNPGMATAGMGDVLSGVIAGLMAQHIEIPLAAEIGVLIHALAGDIAAMDGERGLTATDLLPLLRKLVNAEHDDSDQ